MNSSPRDSITENNVVTRLRQRLSEARAIGFRVRMEALDGEEASWCEIAGVPTLFVDLSRTAAEQLGQVEETLAAYAALRSPSDSPVAGDAHRDAASGDTKHAA